MSEPRSNAARTSPGKMAARHGDARAEAASLLERIHDGLVELPILPDTAARVIAACRDENSGPRTIASLLERDPALAAELLRVANSAAYGGGSAIVSLQQAIGRLGVATVSGIVTAVAVKGRIFAVPRYASEVAGIWHHSASSAAWAREVARLRRRNVEAAFLCGLLHDVGRPLMLQAFADLEHRGTACDPFAILEAVDELHPRVGAELVSLWGLPPWAAGAVAWHREPWLAVDHRDEAFTTSLASQLAHGVFEANPETRDEVREMALRDGLGLYPEDFEALLAHKEQVAEAAGVLA